MAFSKTELNNWISHRQCCFQSEIDKTIALGEQGSKKFLCKMKQNTLGLIYLEMLTELNPSVIKSYIFRQLDKSSDQSGNTVEIYYNDTVSVSGAVVISGNTGLETAAELATAINNTNSVPNFTASASSDAYGNGLIYVYSEDETYEGDTFIIYINSIKVSTYHLLGSQADDSACLTREQMCELIDFIDNTCVDCN